MSTPTTRAPFTARHPFSLVVLATLGFLAVVAALGFGVNALAMH